MHKNNFYPQNLTKPKPAYSKECLDMQAPSQSVPELNRSCGGGISPALVQWQPWDRSPVSPVQELYQSNPKAAEGRVDPNLIDSSLSKGNWGAGSWQQQEHWMQSFCIQNYLSYSLFESWKQDGRKVNFSTSGAIYDISGEGCGLWQKQLKFCLSFHERS